MDQTTETTQAPYIPTLAIKPLIFLILYTSHIGNILMKQVSICKFILKYEKQIEFSVFVIVGHLQHSLWLNYFLVFQFPKNVISLSSMVQYNTIAILTVRLQPSYDDKLRMSPNIGWHRKQLGNLASCGDNTLDND